MSTPEETWAEVVSWLQAGAEYAQRLTPQSIGHDLAVRSWAIAGYGKYLPLLRGVKRRRGESRAGKPSYMSFCKRCGRETRHYGASGRCVEHRTPAKANDAANPTVV